MNLPGIKIGVEGFFKLEAVKPNGERRLLADWFANTISNAGLNRMGTTSSYLETAFVGSGTAAPDDVTFTETALTNPIRSTSVISTTTGNVHVVSASEWYSYKRIVYRIPPQGSSYNASEVAVGDFISAGPPMVYALYSRQLILDGLGAPTTISVLADEYLDITYELRNYPVLDDVVFSLNITGTTPVLHDCVLRPAQVTNAAAWANGLGAEVGSTDVSIAVVYYDGTSVLGAVTAEPTGTNGQGVSSQVVAPYSNGTYRRDITYTFGLTVANLAGGIGAMLFRTSIGYFQVSFDPAIAKTSTKILTITFRVIWARRVLDPSEL